MPKVDKTDPNPKNPANAMTLDEIKIVSTMKAQLKALVGGDVKKAMDSFSNFSARIGAGTDSQGEGGGYVLTRFTFDYQQTTALYRNSWIAQKGIDIPAVDMVKHGILITSDMKPDDIAKIQKNLKKQQQKIIEGNKWSRLYGGAVGVLLIKDAFKKMVNYKDPETNEIVKKPLIETPMQIEDIDVDSFKGIYILDRWNGVSPTGGFEDDIESYQYGRPEFYTINMPKGSSIKIHHSWLLLFNGIELPRLERYADSYWGMSELEPVITELDKRNNTNFSVANLIFQASLRVFKFDGFRQMVATGSKKFQEEMNKTMEQLTKYQSNQRITAIDSKDDFDVKGAQFSGLENILETFMEDLAGAFRIPMDRLWGRPGKGFSGDDKSSQRNYNDYIATLQEERLRHNYDKLLAVISKSTLGHVPDDLDFDFVSLYQSDLETRRSEMEQKLTIINEAFTSGGITRDIYIKELQQVGQEYNIFTNITDKYVEEVEKEQRLDPGDLDPDPDDDDPEVEEKKAKDSLKFFNWITGRSNK